MRFKILIEYDGTDFVGWQKQKDGLGIQEVIEKAIFDFSGENVEIFGAGRTDAGVHAVAQVAHFDLVEKEWTSFTVREAINAKIDKKHKIIITDCVVVSDDFNARFSAVERSYVYKIVNRKARLALDCNRAWWVPMGLNVDDMVKASQVFLGKHDFTSFRASQCQAKSPIRTIDEVVVSQNGDNIEVFVRAKSFLHHQVRNIVGTLAFVGMGKFSVDDVACILEAKNRALAGPTAPACGLYFLDVKYD